MFDCNVKYETKQYKIYTTEKKEKIIEQNPFGQ